MGCGSWAPTDYSTRSATYQTQSREQLFSNKVAKDFDPKFIDIRESCDSDDNPESTAIIVGLDVTGSMGFIAEHIAKESLGTLVEGILDRKPVSDPHIMMMAIGDINCDRAPLQATHFEADIRIADQLTELWLEGGGGGNTFESYDLPWAFAANKTRTDCFDKRSKKGYLFTMGDERPPRTASARVLNESCNLGVQGETTTEQLLANAQERYEVFHIIIEEGGYYRRDGSRVKEEWNGLMGRRAVVLNSYKHVSEVILSIIEVNEGADPADVIAQWNDPATRKAVEYSLHS